jgi:hypothetical protein
MIAFLKYPELPIPVRRWHGLIASSFFGVKSSVRLFIQQDPPSPLALETALLAATSGLHAELFETLLETCNFELSTAFYNETGRLIGKNNEAASTLGKKSEAIIVALLRRQHSLDDKIKISNELAGSSCQALKVFLAEHLASLM